MPGNESNRTIAVVALGAFALALVLHLIAIFTDISRGMPITFILFAVGILSFGALILTVHSRARERGQKRPSVADVFAPLPNWARLLCGVVIVYSLVNFALFMRATDGGTLERRQDGRYQLSDRGRLIRTLDEGGVRAFHTWEVRFFSGHSLPFLVLPGLYFLFAALRQEQGDKVIAPAP
jgi:hypothetical protein